MANPLENMRPPQAGDRQISAALIRELVDQAIASRSVTGPGTQNGPLGLAIQQNPGVPMPVYARITAEGSSDGFYEWEQVRPNLATAQWETPANGLTHNYWGELFLGIFGKAGRIGDVHEVMPVLSEEGKTVRVTLVQSPSFWARIAGNTLKGGASAIWQYGWVEQEATVSGWQDLSGGRSGTTSSNYAINALEQSELLITSAIPDDTIVKLWVCVNDDGSVGVKFAAGGGGGLPAPGLQYQVLQLDAGLVPRWDWTRLSSVSP